MERPHEANRIMGQLYHLLRSGMKEHNLPDIELLLLRAYNLYQNSHNPAPVSPVLPFTSSPLAKSTKWNALHERIALRDQIPLYQKNIFQNFQRLWGRYSKRRAP